MKATTGSQYNATTKCYPQKECSRSQRRPEFASCLKFFSVIALMAAVAFAAAANFPTN